MVDYSGSISLIDFLAAECASVAHSAARKSALQSYITRVMCSHSIVKAKEIFDFSGETFSCKLDIILKYTVTTVLDCNEPTSRRQHAKTTF